MGLFDKIFGKKNNDKTEDKYFPSFWEDDYCQIEIVPRKNITHILEATKQINEFASKTRTEFGFTDIFCRDPLPYETFVEEIRIDYFEKLLRDNNFEKAKQIRYDGNTIIDCKTSTTNAFGFNCFSIFYDCKDEFLNNIWLSSFQISETSQFEFILSALYQLGEECELVLIDWNSLEMIDLANKSQIKNYLKG